MANFQKIFLEYESLIFKMKLASKKAKISRGDFKVKRI